MPTLIIFVDALPYDHLERLPRLAQWQWCDRLRPGFGYSINIHPELYSGLTPDEVGFFGEWTVDPTRAPGRRYRRLLPYLDALFRPYILNRGLQHALTKRYSRDHIMPNIPLSRLGDFAIRGEKVTSAQYPHPSVFSVFPGMGNVDSAGAPKGSRDAVVVERAASMIGSGDRHLHVPLPDLDGIGHTYGTTGSEWSRHLERIDGWIADLSDRFLGRHRDGDVFVISDHGMSDVAGGVVFDPESEVGPQRSDRYLYFTDSTLVRVWVADPSLGPPIADYIFRSQVAGLVEHDEREAYGLTNPQFGDFIAVLDEGLCFKPSTFARNIPTAMHGYHPDVAGQHAVMAHRGAHPPSEHIARTTEVYGTLIRSLSRDAAARESER